MTTTVWHFNCNGTDAVDLATKYSGVDLVAGGMQIAGNGFTGKVAIPALCGVVFSQGVANADTDTGTLHTKDHWAKCTIKNVGLYQCGLIVRATGNTGGGGTDGGYLASINNLNLLTLWKFTNGTFTLLATGVPGSSMAVDETISLTARGSVLTVSHDGVAVITHTDTTHTSGGVGIVTFGNTLSAMGDDLYAGNSSIQKGCQDSQRNFGHQYKTNQPGERRRARFNRIVNVR